MNKADEALADVRRWLCDNLGDGDAGKVCGMLSVVSRRIAEIEEENAKLRELARKLVPELCEQNAALCKENAKLVDVLHEVETEAVYAFQCLQQDCVTATNSPEHYFEKWWHADCECERLAAENTKLRELVAELYEDQCDECDRWKYRDRMRELSVEADR